MARFSTLALAGVGVLTVVGAALAWTVVPSLAALPASVYGRTLLTKLTVVAAVVAVAAYNRLRLLPAVVRGGDGALITLRRTVRLEAAGLLAALAVTALLVNVSPPRPGPGSSTTPTATSTAANHEAPPSTPIPAAHRRGVG